MASGRERGQIRTGLHDAGLTRDGRTACPGQRTCGPADGVISRVAWGCFREDAIHVDDRPHRGLSDSFGLGQIIRVARFLKEVR